MKKEKVCPKCKNHGGTYDINPNNGEIVGTPCEVCNACDCENDIYAEDYSEYVVWARAIQVSKEVSKRKKYVKAT